MVMSWWSLGEPGQNWGSTFNPGLITCPFCEEMGNFTQVFTAHKKKANSTKAIHFDTYRCQNCMGHVQVMWSTDEQFNQRYDFRVQPWPIASKAKPSHNWPDQISRFWIQAKDAVVRENWDAAAVMARSALQAALREQNATGNNLKSEIEDLANRGILPPVMKEWSDELRLIGNESAHPVPNSSAANPDDIKDAVEFLDYLLQYLYDLPKGISNYRARKTPPVISSVEDEQI